MFEPIKKKLVFQGESFVLILPKKWVTEMGSTFFEREVELTWNPEDKSITIKKA